MAALFNVVGFSIFTAFAQLITDTSRVAIMVYTMPIWATLLALPILGERLTPTRVLALGLCVAGMAILIAPLAAVGLPAGALLAVGAAMSWAAGTVYLKWARPEVDLMALSAWQLVVGFAVMSCCIPLFDQAPTLNVPAGALLALLYSGVVGSGFGTVPVVRHCAAAASDDGLARRAVHADDQRGDSDDRAGRAADAARHHRLCADVVGIGGGAAAAGTDGTRIVTRSSAGRHPLPA